MPDGELPGQGDREKPTQVVTKAQVEAKGQEVQGAYSALMDQMEASRQVQGDYFITVGRKEEDGTDNRVLFFKSPHIDKRQKEVYVAITRGGPVRVTLTEVQEIKRLIGQSRMGKMPEDSQVVYQKDWRGDSYPQISFTLEGRLNHINNLVDLMPDDDPPTFVNGALERSVREAEAPHKRNLEKLERGIDLAHSLSATISQLPPKE